jgi:hypothetical protein
MSEDGAGTLWYEREADEAARVRLCSMATFRDGEASRRQIGRQLGALEADFARCLAMSAWAVAKPLRMIVFGLPMHASLDECLLARLRDAGHAVCGLEDAALAPCLESRWEFVRGGECRPARYRPAPSYHERLRVELLLDAWTRASRRPAGIDALEAIAAHLAAATAALSAPLALPLALLRRAAAEHRVDAASDERLRRQLRRSLVTLGEDDVRHLAIAAALDGAGDLAAAVQRFGTAPMRVLLRAHLDRPRASGARVELAPRLARLRREIWTPVARA